MSNHYVVGIPDTNIIRMSTVIDKVVKTHTNIYYIVHINVGLLNIGLVPFLQP